VHQISIFTFSVAALMETRWEPGVAKMPPSETKCFEINEPSWSRRADDKKATEAVARSLTKVILLELAVFLPRAAPFMPSLQCISMFAKVKIWRQDD